MKFFQAQPFDTKTDCRVYKYISHIYTIKLPQLIKCNVGAVEKTRTSTENNFYNDLNVARLPIPPRPHEKIYLFKL